MIVFPAIDIRQGRCVRLMHGDFERETVYGDDPVAMAKRFLDEGATHLHVVDLDGARTGRGENLAAIEAIAKLGAFVQTGGGIRGQSDVARRMDCGVFRVVLGTAAVETPALVDWAVARYGDAIALGVDVRDGEVAVRGWESGSGMTAQALCLSMKARGIGTVIFTQIARDGAQTGPDVPASAALAAATGLEVVVSGGVGGVCDIRAVADAGLAGVIVGRALYEGTVALSQALQYHRVGNRK